VALLALSGKNKSFKSTASKIYKRARPESVHKERAKLDVATVNSPGHPDPLGRAVSLDNIFDVENSSGFVSTGKGIMVLDFEESHYTSLRVLGTGLLCNPMIRIWRLPSANIPAFYPQTAIAKLQHLQ
jgi:hypothetical protein